MERKSRLTNKSGFTLIELMIVIAIIGILAAIAIPNFIQYRQKAYDSNAETDTKNAFTSAQAYFTDHPNYNGDITYGALTTAGFRMTSAVTFSNISGSRGSLSMTFYHVSGRKNYSVNSEGVISSVAR